MDIKTERTVVVLGNAAELVSNIVKGVMGNEVADTINGSPLTQNMLHNLTQTSLQDALSAYTGVK